MTNYHWQIPEFTVGRHSIRYFGYIEGFGPFEFEVDSISVRQTGYKSYIQTDKPIYKPGELVRLVRATSIQSAYCIPTLRSLI